METPRDEPAEDGALPQPVPPPAQPMPLPPGTTWQRWNEFASGTYEALMLLDAVVKEPPDAPRVARWLSGLYQGEREITTEYCVLLGPYVDNRREVFVGKGLPLGMFVGGAIKVGRNVPRPSVADAGSLVITNQRYVFLGHHAAYEWRIQDILRVSHDQDTPTTTIHARSYAAASSLGYDFRQTPRIRVCMEFAAAWARGESPVEFVRHFAYEYERVRLAEPSRPPRFGFPGR